ARKETWWTGLWVGRKRGKHSTTVSVGRLVDERLVSNRLIRHGDTTERQSLFEALSAMGTQAATNGFFPDCNIWNDLRICPLSKRMSKRGIVGVNWRMN